MRLLTEDQILRDIAPFIYEWNDSESWWFGSSTAYLNAQLGYDCEVYINKETQKLECLVYDLVEDKNDKGHLVISKDTLFKFEIKRKIENYEVGNILSPIALEEDSPFVIGTNYLVTAVEELERDDKRVKIYTLNDHIDFRYSSTEISGYFKKAVLS